MSQEEDQQIGGEGDAVMHMNLPALTDEYKLCFSAKVENGPELRQTRGQCVYDRRNFAVGPVHEDFEVDGILTVANCVH